MDENPDAMLARLLARRPQSPSHRKPTMSTHNNEADQIEKFLQEDGHRTWGLVVYRCTYESDSDWEEFIRRLRLRTERNFEFYNGLDMLESFKLTVFEDRSLFDGADTSTIRNHFRQWATTAPQLEQSTGPGISQRYRYCVHVDAEALRSVVHDAPALPDPDATNKGTVNVIDGSWQQGRSEGKHDPPVSFEAVEGVMEWDVGWIKVPYWELMGHWYCSLRGRDAWMVLYCRPLSVAGYRSPQEETYLLKKKPNSATLSSHIGSCWGVSTTMPR